MNGTAGIERQTIMRAIPLPVLLLILTAACSGSEPSPADLKQLPEVLTKQDLQAMPTELIWEVGARRLGWSSLPAPESWPKDKLIEVFLESQRCSGDNSPTAPPEDRAPYAWTRSPEAICNRTLFKNILNFL